MTLLLETGGQLLNEDGSLLLLEDAIRIDNVGHWFDGLVDISVQFAISAQIVDSGVWDLSLFDDGRFGPDIIWTEVGKYCRSFSTNRRFDRDLASWTAGTSTIVLDNRDGRFSPSNPSSPFTFAGVTGIRPWRPVRILATYNSVQYSLFRGYALEWAESYDTSGGSADAIVTVPCVDEWGHIAACHPTGQAYIGILDLPGPRLHRILNNINHTGPRAIDVGQALLGPTNLASNPADEMRIVAASDGGSLYVDTDGTVVYNDRFGLIENTASETVQATFGDDPTDTTELQYSDLTLAYNGDLVANVVHFGRTFTDSAGTVSGTPVTVTDNSSRALYGDLTPADANRSDLICISDAHVTSLANLYLALHKDPEQLVTDITVLPRTNPSLLFPQVLGRKLRDLLTILRRPVGDYTIEQESYIAGVHHTVTADGDWTTKFDLWSATAIRAFSVPVWDTGLWDDAEWFY